MREAVRSIDSEQPLAPARVLDQAISDSILPRSLTALLVAVFAFIGLLLAVAGVYALISCRTFERRREIAVRMVVGADRRHIIMMVLRQSGRLVVAGGLIGSPLTTNTIRRELSCSCGKYISGAAGSSSARCLIGSG